MRDEEFIRTDVPMTKEAVRILTLDWLALAGAQTFIDVGAGTGSVSIEAALRYPNLNVIAIEQKPEAVALIKLNQEKFAVENISLIEGKAPLALEQAAGSVDALFIGGSGGSLAAIIHWAHELLKPGGRLVLNFILLNNLMEALSLMEAQGSDARFEEVQVNELLVSQLTKLGKGRYFKPNNPTFIIHARKGGIHE